MIPIRNQPISFPDVNPNVTQDGCITDSEMRPLVYLLDQPIDVQFRREVGNAISCPLISPTDITELVENGDFDDATGWTLSEWGIAGGVATSTDTGGAIFISRAIGATTGTAYTVTFTVTLPPGETITPVVGSNAGSVYSSSGTFSEVIVCGAGSDLVFNGTGAGIVLDDVSTIETVVENDCFTFPGWDFTETAITHTVGETTPITFDGLTVGQHYKVVISFTDWTEGFCIIKNGTTQLGLHDPEVNTYYFEATDTDFTINPSSEFDGGFITIDIYPHDYFVAGDLLLTGGCSEAFADVDLLSYVEYRKDFATLSFIPEDVSVEVIACCGYQISFINADAAPVLSNQIELVEELDCNYKSVIAWCDCECWGFNHNTYRHRMNVPMRFTNPSYIYANSKNSDTTGMHVTKFNERSKQWICRLTEGQAMDEAFHDAFSIMLQCKYLQIDGTLYDCPDSDYVPNWEESKGEGLVAPGQFNLRLKTDVIFDRDGSCIPHVYNLRVLAGWSTTDYYKAMDGYNTDYIGTVFRAESIVINGAEQLTSPEFFELDSVTTTATGINGNLVHAGTKGVGISGEIPQSVSDWINELLERHPIRFYDDMSVVHYREDIEFEITISISSYPNPLSMDKGPYVFSNTGKYITGNLTTLNYVA